jgi:ankyrin repeat protein
MNGNLHAVKDFVRKNPQIIHSIKEIELIIPLETIPQTCEFTPLACAAAYGEYKIAEFLVLHGADINWKDKNGKTPLYWVGKRNRNRKDITELLLRYGAKR